MNSVQDIYVLLQQLGVSEQRYRALSGLVDVSPITGEVIATLKIDTAEIVGQSALKARQAQKNWVEIPRAIREEFLEFLSLAVKARQKELSAIIIYEGGKTVKEAEGEAGNAADILSKTVKDAKLADLGDFRRVKEREPVGLVGVITSFNFPLAVANWNIAPALLAGNAVLWKPSEKTPLTALAYEAIYEQAVQQFNAQKAKDIVPAGLLQVVVGERETGQALVASEDVDMICATGSVGMGQAIKNTLAQKKNKGAPPILELGGNNAVVVSEKNSEEYLERAVTAIVSSVFGTSGQRCTNTRRLIVHEDVYTIVVNKLNDKYISFIGSGAIKSPLVGESIEHGYGPLIDLEALHNFEQAMKEATAQGGTILFGKRMLAEDIQWRLM